MTKVVTFLPIATVLLWACSSTKKRSEASGIKIDSTIVLSSSKVKGEYLVDTTKTTKGHMIITKIEFSSADSVYHSGIKNLSIIGGNINISGIQGNPIRSIKQTSLEEESEHEGQSKESKEEDNRKQVASLQKETTKQTKQEEPAPAPYKWQYIFCSSLVVLTGVLYFKRVPIINWIKQILRGLIKRC